MILKSSPGRVSKHHLDSDPLQLYYVYLPTDPAPQPSLMVTVHGISRNAREHAKRLCPLAERLGWVLVAPLFNQERFPDYQRLGRIGRGMRADRMLDQIVAEVERRYGVDGSRFHLFGYSGGGQFAHRYAMAYPLRIRRLAIGAAGWYTFPDPAIAYPHGIRPSRKLPGVTIHLERFLCIPIRVLVGDRDNRPDAELNQSPRIERRQGSSRLERGRSWIEALEQAAQSLNVAPRYRLDVLPGAGHSFRQCMRSGLGQQLADFFASRPIPATPPPVSGEMTLPI